MTNPRHETPQQKTTKLKEGKDKQMATTCSICNTWYTKRWASKTQEKTKTKKHKRKEGKNTKETKEKTEQNSTKQTNEENVDTSCSDPPGCTSTASISLQSCAKTIQSHRQVHSEMTAVADPPESGNVTQPPWAWYVSTPKPEKKKNLPAAKAIFYTISGGHS